LSSTPPDYGPIPFPEDVLTEIGRLTVAATGLEFMLAQFAATVQESLRADELLSRPGMAVSEARGSAALLAPSLREAFASWIAEAAALLQERHKVVHAVWMIRAVAPGVGEYFGRHARTQTEFDARAETIGELAGRLDRCTTQGFELIFQFGPKALRMGSGH
jgi:hypothetical protein